MPRSNAFAKRAFDIVVAFCGLIICVPIMLLVCIAIKWDSKGPILFSQMRLGHRGKLFRIYKFRKFFHSATLSDPAVTPAGDKRMTPVGQVLQKTKLDELPQLWNVLRGDMSVVGPRPETVEFADCFTNGFERVLDFKPGLVGPTQVLFRDEAVLLAEHSDAARFYRDVLFGVKARVDLVYFSKANVLLDLWWLMTSLTAVVLPGRFRNGDDMLKNTEEWMRKSASTPALDVLRSEDGSHRIPPPEAAHRVHAMTGASTSRSWLSSSDGSNRYVHLRYGVKYDENTERRN